MQIFLLKSRPCKVVSRGIKTVSFASTSFAKLKKTHALNGMLSQIK